jgi:hypothetical protein
MSYRGDTDSVDVPERHASGVRPLRNVLAHTHTRGPTCDEIKAFRDVAAGVHIALLSIEESVEMSQKTVQLVIGRLVTDEELRARFVERPRETLTELREQGFELTEDEIDALARSDAKMWPAMARRIHPRLQRCSLRSR